jgi:serine/threonine-protein kinase
VQNLSLAAAEQQIRASHLQVGAVTDEASSTVPKGYVISSTPTQGNSVPENTVVSLDVSSGVGQVTVPPVKGQQVTAAESNLSNVGLNFTTTANPACTTTANQVLSQSPAAGQKVSPGSTVSLTYCGGGTQVPSVTGLSLQSAETSLSAAGFTYTVKTEAGPAGTQPGNVWQQDPLPNTNQAPKTQITLLVQPNASPSPSGSQPGGGGSPLPSAPASGGGGSPIQLLPSLPPPLIR